MLDKLLLNWQPYKITENNLPVFITYGKNMGGSHLSIVLIADLFLQGSKILFLSAYPMARDNFLNQVGENNSKIEWIAVRPDTLINKENESEYEIFASIKRSPVFDAGKTSRINVAHFMVELLLNKTLWEKWKFKMPVIYNK